MEKLNELVEQAKEISSKNWFINSDEEVTAIDKGAGPDDSEEVFIGCAANIQLAKYITSASPETILAIAEAFRALECESDIHIDTAASMREWRLRAEAAEAKLNELAKQEPVAWTSQANLETLKSEQRKTLEFMTGDSSIYSNPVPLYARPAPSVSLAELVPCPYPCGWNNLLSHSMTDAAFLASGLLEGEPVSAGQRESVVLNNDRLIKVITAILRNIEEANERQKISQQPLS